MKNTERFVQALARAEKSHAPEPLLDLFSDDAELMRLNSDEPYHGPQGARDFWTEYLSLFRDVRSQFTNIVESGETAVLEWEASGHFEHGAPVNYRGITVVEFAEDRIRRFRTYYDSAAFTQPAHA